MRSTSRPSLPTRVFGRLFAAASCALLLTLAQSSAQAVNPTVTISAIDASAAEAGNDPGTFRITRAGDLTGDLTVTYTIAQGAGQATNGVDYTPALSGTVIIPADQASVDITITPVDDILLEGDETVTLTLAAGASYDLGATITATVTIADNETDIDLSKYVRVGRYDLPEPTRTVAPANSLLCQEASSVTYNWNTDTLFVVGDGGTSVVQVSKTGQLINSMTLAQGSSPQGTEFYDTEGITYVGGGQFVFTEERYRQANLFTYVPGGTLQRSATRTVKLGTTIGNIGLEGVCYDSQTSGFIFVKEKDPESIFQTGIDFNALTATNGSPTATGSTDLFSPALANTLDFSDVFALSNLPALAGKPATSHLLIISQESGKVVHLDRSGTTYSSLTIVADAGNPLSVPDQTFEGVTMDRDGVLYLVCENGGGDSNHPQLWVYKPSTAANLAPTAVTLNNPVASIPENTSTAAPVKVADILVTDDGLGTNNLTVSGADAATFQIIGTALFIKTGTTFNASTKPSYSVTVSVDDPTVGSTPDATVNYALNITAATGGTAQLIISEVAAWSSGTTSVAADWFEVTNIGTAAQNITGWKVDDNSNSSTLAVALNGVTSIAPGESVIFIETSSQTTVSNFRTTWFGANPASTPQIGTYSGSGVGLSTGGDALNLYDASGVLQANVVFGTSPSSPLATFDNAVGLNNATISTLSAVGVHGAFAAAGDANQIGSPGTIGAPPTPIISITATDATASEVGADPGTFRISRTGSTVNAQTVSYTIATGAGQATNGTDYTPTLSGAVTIPSGASFVDITITPVDDSLVEGPETVTLTLGDSGSYDVGTPGSATITIADDVPNQVPAGSIVITEVAPWSSGNSPLAVDWFEVTNVGATTIHTTGWRMDDNSNSFGTSVPMSGVTTIAPGESVIFMETTDLAGKSAAFKTLWFGGNPPAGLQFGTYSGSGVGLSTSGDAVNIFDSAGNVITGVTFGTAPATAPFATFENKARLGSSTLPGPFFASLAVSGVNGDFAASGDANEVGSPGTASFGLIAASGTLDLIATLGAPAGSTFSGPGVTGGTFDPTGLTGVQTITYTYPSGAGPLSTTFAITVSQAVPTMPTWAWDILLLGICAVASRALKVTAPRSAALSR